MSKSITWGILSVLGCTLFHFTLGYFNTIGNMTPYLQDFLNITTSQTIWMNSVTVTCLGVSMPIGGFLYKKIGFRYVLVISAILSSGGVMLSRFTISAGFGPFMITYVILFGCGIGLPYSVLYLIGSAWFPEHRALTLGIIAAGFGFTPIIITPIQAALINPENESDFSSPSITRRLPDAFLIIGGMLLCLQIVAFSIIREKTSDEISDERDTSKSVSASDQVSYEYFENISPLPKQPDTVRNYTLKDSLRQIDFYILFAISFLNAIPGTLFSSTYKKYGKDFYNDDRYLTIIATIFAVFGCLGRVLWSALVDKFSFKFPLGWYLCQTAVLFATFPIISLASSNVFKALYPVWVFSLNFTLAGRLVLIPSATLRIFGPLNMSTVYGLIYLAIAPSTLLLSTTLSQFNINGKWVEVYLSCTVVSTVGFILSLFLNDRSGYCTGCSEICANVCNVCRSEFEEGSDLVSKESISP